MNGPDDADAARSHVLLRLDEPAVRAKIAEVIATDETPRSLTADDVTDGDIHAACCAVVETGGSLGGTGGGRLPGRAQSGP
jgi:hypothetical protein